MQDREFGPKFAEIVIFYGSHSNPDIASQTFSFWCEIASEFEKGMAYMMRSADIPRRRGVGGVHPFVFCCVLPVLGSAIEEMYISCKLRRNRCDSTGSWLTHKDYGEFVAFRKDISECIAECHKFMGTKCLTQIYDNLVQALNVRAVPSCGLTPVIGKCTKQMGPRRSCAVCV